MRHIYLFILIITFLTTQSRAQLHYKVVQPADASECGTTGECASNCCNDMTSKVVEKELLYYEEGNCNPNQLKAMSNFEGRCFNISQDDIGFFFGKVRPKYFYIEPNASLDANIGNTSLSAMANLFITFYKPLKRLNINNWLVGGLRTGVGYGAIVVDTDSSLNGQSLLKLFKTEVLIGKYNKKNETTISVAAGISPLNYRNGEDIKQGYPHISVNFSKLLTKNNGFNIPKSDKKR